MGPVTLRMMLAALPEARVTGSPEGCVVSLVCDSRDVVPGSMFVAIRGGQELDRHRFLPDAVARGASVLVVEDRQAAAAWPQCTVVQVADTRRALARLAAVYYGNPGASLQLIGVTGTNGKTTTALLLQQILQANGTRCGYLGTLGVHTEAGHRMLTNTTPEAPELHAQLRHLVDGGATSAVLEVSSHGLALERVSGLRFEAAVFTNLSRDHLDFHGTEQRYLDAKARLFEHLDQGAVAWLNADDPATPELKRRCAVPARTYGRNPQAEWRLTAIEAGSDASVLHMEMPQGNLSVSTRLLGSFNAMNVTAAAACSVSLGVPLEVVVQGIGSLRRIPGRFETVDCGQLFRVLVDYAHTPAGLDNVLGAAREITRGRLLCVFGCGGDRDAGKRPLMGQVAERLADRVFVTSDNPRSEDPLEIIRQIAAGMERAGVAVVQEDRRKAIAAALTDARAGDTVVIAGKGHEEGQIVGNRVIPFDDAAVVRELLQPQTAADQEMAG